MNQRPHILVIEDDVEIRSLLRDYLAREGFRVDVGDGGAALDRFRATLGEPDLVVLDKRHVAHADGSELSLTSAEFDLLGCFLARPNRVLSREQLMDWTRGRQADPLDRTIDVQVSRLRKKIERDGELIKTVRSAGY